jgi:glycosyltransferase involved in cell wall biosynthesis
MLIIAAKNAFLKNRTGIEEYTFQLIDNLKRIEKKEEVVIYTNRIEGKVDFSLNFHLKIIHFPILWTQVGLSWQVLKRLTVHGSRFATTLFIPAHVMPLIHPKNTIVTIHGLEYEYFPQYYSWFSRKYLRWSTRYATKHASRIIAVSENTKNDLIKLYGCPSEKIEVIWHGVPKVKNEKFKTKNDNEKCKILNSKYFLYLGRIELKKNVLGIIKAFEEFKIKNYKLKIINYKLVLAGGKGYGWESVKLKVKSLKFKEDIVFTGHIEGERKWELLRNATALVFPSFYEGFGLPILEAQSVGVPVITSKGSSMEEVTTFKSEIRNTKYETNLNSQNSKFKTNTGYIKKSAILVDPYKPQEIVEAMREIINNQQLRDELIRLGYENAKRFSWKRTAQKTLQILTDCHR